MESRSSDSTAFEPGRRQASLVAGYSLVELLMVVGIMGVVSSMAVLQLGQARQSLDSDGAQRVVIAQLTAAREMAVTQRRQIEVRFLGTNQVQLVRSEIPNGTTTLSTVALEGNVQYLLVAGMTDTPDGFGIRTAIDFGAAARIVFSSEGMLINELGNPLNGTVYLAIPYAQPSFRAVTVLGATGRIRGYRWDGAHWQAV